MPTANITVRKDRRREQRTSSCERTVYIEDGTEFEIELYNPLQSMLACQVKIDGKDIGNMQIVLKPGQRAFLERYIDTPRKFKFSTYEVGTDATTRHAVANNGRVEVRFFRELTQQPLAVTNYSWSYLGPSYTVPCSSTPSTPTVTWGTNQVASTLGLFNDADAGPVNAYNCSSRSFDQISEPAPELNRRGFGPSLKRVTKDLSMETGMTEKGSASQQVFDECNYHFETFAFHTATMLLLPPSRVEASDIRVYCTECGTKRKADSWKFCPKCGTAL